MSIPLLRRLILTILVSLLTGCHAPDERSSSQWPEMEKIKFSTDDIRSDGLRGPPDGLVAVSYELCVPDSDNVRQYVQTIDPTLQVYAGSPGRSACTTDQVLAIGNTHQPGWREVLQALSSLAYVSEIQECFFE